ncbi:hypothetical protein [Phaeobacter sp. B1627]|uniref:hypothetical protein n=1 Tax=Phaeobacter sp. B1627 TaxID=2583809 RepID=UPI001117B364|nr:hypothetical protein [Phaeobacter sp. B1627]TNJ41959.1 hypothetical protein FGE21_11850 [Phaeobacter sp. B1627]
MTATQFIAVDAAALESLQAELREIKRILQASHVTPPAKWITVKAYAEKVGRSEATVRRWVRQGQLERNRKLVRNPDV